MKSVTSKSCQHYCLKTYDKRFPVSSPPSFFPPLPFPSISFSQFPYLISPPLPPVPSQAPNSILKSSQVVRGSAVSSFSKCGQTVAAERILVHFEVKRNGFLVFLTGLRNCQNIALQCFIHQWIPDVHRIASSFLLKVQMQCAWPTKKMPNFQQHHSR